MKHKGRSSVVCVVSRTISKQYAGVLAVKYEHNQHLSSPEACMSCTKRRKSLCATQLESSMSKKRTKYVYKIHTDSDRNFMYLECLEYYFLGQPQQS